MLDTAKIFENGRSQAIRLPKKYRFTDDEVYIRRFGELIMLIPMSSAWQLFLDGLHSFTDDFMESGREEAIPSRREIL